jgi:hypothetical protein
VATAGGWLKEMKKIVRVAVVFGLGKE